MRQRDFVCLAILFFSLSAAALAKDPWQALSESCAKAVGASGTRYMEACTHNDQYSSIVSCLRLKQDDLAKVIAAHRPAVNAFMEDKKPFFCLGAKTTQIQDRALSGKLTDFQWKSNEVGRQSINYEYFTKMDRDVMKLNRDNATTLKMRETKEGEFRRAVERRDEAANRLAGAITKAMEDSKKNNNQELGKQLEHVYDEIQAINKTTNDAELRYDETLALLDEQAWADDQAKRAAAVATKQ